MTYDFIIPVVLQLEILAIVGINLRDFIPNTRNSGR
jgi:hypothetical protein